MGRGIGGRLGAAASSLATTGGVLFFAAFTVVNASNFLFHLAVSRTLLPSEYGALGALLGLVLVLTVPAAALQVVITREVASRRGPAAETGLPIVVGPLLAQSVIWGTLGGVTLLLAAPLLKSFLHLPSLSSAAMLAALVVPMAIGLVPKAVLLGEMRFRRVAVGILAGAATKLGLGIALVRAGAGIDGAMGATVLGELVAAAVLLPGLRNLVSGLDDVEPVRVRWRDATGTMIAFSGFWLLTAVDTLLVRHYLSGSESGFYTAAATAARAALFLPAAVATIAFPVFASGGEVGSRQRAALVQALVVVTVLGFGTGAAFLLVPDLVIRILFGALYEGSSGVLGILGISSACAGLISVLMHFHIASRRRVASSLCWAGVAVAGIGIAVTSHSLRSAALVTLTVTAVVMLVMLWLAFVGGRQPEMSYMTRELWTLSGADLDLTFVVPYYNPGTRLRVNLERLLDTLRSSNLSFEIIAVSDGSTDGSDLTIQDLGQQVRCIALPHNVGKGQALRVGLAMGRGHYLGFIDADGDIDLALLGPFLSLVRLYDPDVVLGSKRHPMSLVQYPALRRVYSWGFQQLIRVLFRLNVRDTQTGLKLVRRDVLAQTLPRMREKRFAFDLELFVVARHLGYRRFFEAPVSIEHHFTSTISVRSVREMLADTLAIFYRLRLVRYYDRPPSSSGTVTSTVTVSTPDHTGAAL